MDNRIPEKETYTAVKVLTDNGIIKR